MNSNRTFPTTLSWDVDTTAREPQGARYAIFQGDTVVFEAQMLHLGAPVVFPLETTATFYWRPKHAKKFFEAPANVNPLGRLAATFTPKMDNGKKTYEFFIGAKHNGQITYRAFGFITMLPSPGFVPNQIPFPVNVIDFGAVKILNADKAPWLTDAHNTDPKAHPGIRNTAQAAKRIARKALKVAQNAGGACDFEQLRAAAVTLRAQNPADPNRTKGENDQVLSALLDALINHLPQGTTP